MPTPDEPLSPARARRRFARRIVVAVAANFVGYVLFSTLVGGTALHGMVEDGRHYVQDMHERYALVSRSVFVISQVWGWAVVASLPVLLLATGLMRRGED